MSVGDEKPVTVAVRFDPRVTSAKRLGLVARRALESDPRNRAAVKITYQRE